MAELCAVNLKRLQHSMLQTFQSFINAYERCLGFAQPKTTAQSNIINSTSFIKCGMYCDAQFMTRVSGLQCCC